MPEQSFDAPLSFDILDKGIPGRIGYDPRSAQVRDVDAE